MKKKGRSNPKNRSLRKSKTVGHKKFVKNMRKLKMDEIKQRY
jgi:hypothetical protein